MKVLLAGKVEDIVNASWAVQHVVAPRQAAAPSSIQSNYQSMMKVTFGALRVHHQIWTLTHLRFELCTNFMHGSYERCRVGTLGEVDVKGQRKVDCFLARYSL